MHTVKRSVLVPFSAAQMFDLVADVAAYPEFLPWCGGAQVYAQDEKSMEASVTIKLGRLEQTFRTKNIHDYPSQITLNLVSGPFSHLHGQWQFKSLTEEACKVEFILEYQFSNRPLELLVGPIFSRIAQSFIDSFIDRAKKVYVK